MKCLYFCCEVIEPGWSAQGTGAETAHYSVRSEGKKKQMTELTEVSRMMFLMFFFGLGTGEKI